MPGRVNPLLTFQAFHIKKLLGGSSNFLFVSLRGTPLSSTDIMLHCKRIMFNVIGRACSQQEMREIIGARFYRQLVEGDTEANRIKEQMLYLFNHHELTHKIYYKRYN